VDVSGATIVDPETAPELERYIEDLVEARKKKVTALGHALEHISTPAQCRAGLHRSYLCGKQSLKCPHLACSFTSSHRTCA